MRTALTIAGSDSTSGAGIQADIKTFAAFSVYGLSAITAVTAQSTTGITATLPLPADVVSAQIETVAGDTTIHATKTGMLATAAIVEAVAAAIEELELPFVVVDPVLISTSGTRLLDDDGIQMLCAELIPRCAVVTPNIPEAEVLSGKRITSMNDAREAAKRIRDVGAQAVVVTGGHGTGDESIDLFFDGRTFTEMRTARLPGGSVHGTGCAYAAALAAGLASGFKAVQAARLAQAYVAGAMRHAVSIGQGAAVLDQFWQMMRRPK
jgi:hydroxymethylpyrimidine/phosphomethylpyrimidine kinase